MKKNYTKTAVQGSIVIFIFTIVSIFIGFLLRTFLAKNLTVAEYGLLYAVIAFFGLFALFRDAGLNPALVKYIPEFLVKKEKKKIKSAITFTICVQAILTIFIFSVIIYSILYHPFLTQEFFKTELAVPIVILIGMSFAFGIFFHLTQSLFIGFQKMRLYAVMDPIRAAIVLVAAFISINLGIGITGVAFGYFAAILITGVVGFVLFLRIFPFFKIKSKTVNIDKDLRDQLKSFALPVVGGGIASIVASYIDTVMLTYFRTLDEVGYYQVALPVSDLVGIFVGAMSIVTFPMVSELWARGKKAEVSNGLSTLTKFSLLVIIPAALIIFIFSETIVGIFFGAKYFPAIIALRILVVAAIFQALSTIYFAALKGIGKIRDAVKGIIVLSVSILVLNFFLVQKFGIVGTAIATLISYMITVAFTLYILSKSVKIRISANEVTRILLSASLAGFAGYYMKEKMPVFYDIPGILICLVVYAAAIIFLGVVRKDDIKTLERSGIRLPSIIYRIAR